jgi:hypothetical protein
MVAAERGGVGVGVKGVGEREGDEEGVQRVIKGGGREGDEGGVRGEADGLAGRPPPVDIHPRIVRAVTPRHKF